MPGCGICGPAAFLLYAMIRIHVFWIGTPAAVSAAFIGPCTGMIGVSFGLYGVWYARALGRNKTNGGVYFLISVEE